MTYTANLSLIPFSDRGYPGFQRSPHFESDLYYNHPTYPRGHSNSPVARLKNERLRCERNLGWSIDFATAFLVNHLSPDHSPDAAHILKSIRKKAQQVFDQGRGQDVPYLAFSKLDDVLFAGHLGGAVYLDLRSLGHDVSGATYTHGRGPDPRVKRISIVLNNNVLQQAQPRDIVANLIHHMIHAFFLVACGPEEEKEVGYGRLSHGMHFGKVANTIKKLSAVHGKPLPLGFSRYLYGHSYYDEYHPRRENRHSSRWYRSNCHSDVPSIPEPDIEDFYEGICAPLLDLPEPVQKAQVLIYNERRHCLEEVHRASDLATPSADSVEFLFEEKPVQVPRSKVEHYMCVNKAFDRAKGRYLEVPDGFSKDTFLTLLELLHTDTYSPDIRPVTACGKSGPPVIKSYQSDSLPYLLTDIHVFKLANEMRFDDVKAIALDRLRCQVATHEDPIIVLKALYDGGEPDPDLRDWARKFLLKTPSDDMWASAHRRTLPSLEPPNLVKLQKDYMLRERFYALIPRFGALESDVRQAEESLLRGGRLSPGPYGMYAVPGPMSPPPPTMGFGHPYGMPSALGIGAPPPAVLMDEWGEGFRRESPFRIGYGEREWY
ncbi:hypothetical protein BDV96DRAFT_654942 [Lophiotrema nucula]|uniref:Uncharacterized protein n=1 Tax=Lophiotrema nucula TaxID=690887 RepID=A0A6A5YGS7_9PLEO|nr:hypothetical protein BDV96DRAFT_654942 [Lophiotrema nucula]